MLVIVKVCSPVRSTSGPKSKESRHDKMNYGMKKRGKAEKQTNPLAMAGEGLQQQRVGVGVGVIIVKEGRLVLVGRRRSSLGNAKFALPGGHLEFGETWEECASREVLEETGLAIHKIRFAAVTNAVMLNEVRPSHYVTIFMRAELVDEGQQAQNLEPDKCDGWEWVEWPHVPRPIFEPLQILIDDGYTL